MVEANLKIIQELKEFLCIVVTDPEFKSEFITNPQDFSRDRKMPMEKVIGFLLNLPKRTLSIELEEFFNALGEPQSVCTTGAFCLQRVKLKASLFQVWNQFFVNAFYDHYGSSVKRWQGFRLMAVDGSRYYLVNKPAIIKHFGTSDNQHGGVAMAQVMQVQDVLNDITIWGDIYPIKKGEQTIISEQVSRLPTDSLTLFDRGFASYSLMYLMQNEEEPRHFVMRCKTGMSNEVKAFMQSRKRSNTVIIYPNKNAIKQLRLHGYIVTKTTPLKVRMVKIILSTGETEVLLTDLYDEKKYTLPMLKELYAMRWAIETTYSKQKNQQQAEVFSGHKVICIQQDFAASLFIANLQSLVTKQCDNHIKELNTKRKHRYKINRNVSWAALKHRVVKLFLEYNSETILMELQKAFEKHVQPVRPGRSYQRLKKAKKINGKYQTFTNYRRAV